jgi:hypothetical protein
MNKVIVHVDPDTGVTCVTRCVPSAKLAGETEEEFAERVATKLELTRYSIVDDDPILDGDRTFRNALKCVDGVFSHDMTKARTLWMDRIRMYRDAELARLDVETIKAVGGGDDVRRAEVEAQKQILRDITATFDLSVCATTEQLKAAWPVEVPRSNATATAVVRHTPTTR